MSKSEISKRKQHLLDLERKVKKKIQSETDSVEKNVSQVLKTGLIVGGVLFAGYQLVRLFTSSSDQEPAAKKKIPSSP